MDFAEVIYAVSQFFVKISSTLITFAGFTFPAYKLFIWCGLAILFIRWFKDLIERA